MINPSVRERRRHPRLAQKLPVRVVGYAPNGSPWEETTTTRDVSQGGISMILPRSSFKGQVLQLALPLPRSLREFDQDEPELRVYGIVRDTIEGHGVCQLGVKFFGKQPPRGFDRTPGAAFLMPSDLPPVALSAPAEESAPKADPAPTGDRRTRERDPQDWRHRRRHERLQMFVAFHLQQLDEWGAVLAEERTVSENVSLGGARLKTTGHFCVGEVVVLRQASGAFETRAQVKGFTVGPDGGNHVGVMFLDAGPEHLVRSH
ncbi:MAG TPA: PilZ domain-containing protein [Vicinamibacteria bacterium]|nr:PilZ domain-containing protein [Vicinamibacteria bacterium]